MSCTRLDQALAERGLARSRSHAVQLIKEGLVSVGGRAVVKPSALVGEAESISVDAAGDDVSRGAVKLRAALNAWPIAVRGALCLDVGASTGGFTQVLLERGAASVIALDVGHGQLAPRLREDTRVVNVEGVNARELTAALLAQASGVAALPEVIVGDLSFIGLPLVIPALAATLNKALSAQIVLLVKPQFEVGRTGIKEGVVTDPGLRVEAVEGVLWAAWDAGWGTRGVIRSPIVGSHGNVELLVWFAPRRADDGTASAGDPRGEGNPSQWLQTVAELAGAR